MSEMADQPIDLYGDLDDYDSAEQLKKTEKQCLDLKGRLRECEEQKLMKDKEFQMLNKDFRNMNANLNSLFQTAKTEIQRKDNQIRDLRKELDNVRFRRDRRVQNEKNSQLRHVATQTDVLNEPEILQENQMKNEEGLGKSKERIDHFDENWRHSKRNPFSSSRKECLHVKNLKDELLSDSSREKNDRSRHRHTDNTHRSKQNYQKNFDRQNFERTKRHRSRSSSRDRKRARRSKSKPRDRPINRYTEEFSPKRNAYKEAHRTSDRKSEHKRRSPESTSKGDLRDKSQKYQSANENMERHEKQLLDNDQKVLQENVGEKPKLSNYVSNGFESETMKAENRISPHKNETQKYENLEDGEIIDENSCEDSPAEHITNEKVAKMEKSSPRIISEEHTITANGRMEPFEISNGKNRKVDMEIKAGLVLPHDEISAEKHLSVTRSNLDSEVKTLEVNSMKSVISENGSKSLKMDPLIETGKVSTNEFIDKQQINKRQSIPHSCTSSYKNEEVSDRSLMSTSGLSDTSKVVKNISTSSTDYILVEDDENNDVIIYVSRKKRKKKKSLGNH